MKKEGKNLLRDETWKEDTLPKDWEVGILLPMYKKEDNQGRNNYIRSILLSVAMEIY